MRRPHARAFPTPTGRFIGKRSTQRGALLCRGSVDRDRAARAVLAAREAAAEAERHGTSRAREGDAWFTASLASLTIRASTNTVNRPKLSPTGRDRTHGRGELVAEIR